MYEVYIPATVLDKVLAHFNCEAGRGLEAMGLLLGMVCSHNGSEYAVVEEYVTGRNSSSPVSVKFHETAFAELSTKINGRLVVGWAHSHPGFGCFLSSTDLETQRKYFSEPFHCALVVDPLRKEKKIFKAAGSGYREASYAVIKKKKT